MLPLIETALENPIVQDIAAYGVNKVKSFVADKLNHAWSEIQMPSEGTVSEPSRGVFGNSGPSERGVHFQRLVGVEPNPGPKKGKGKNNRKGKPKRRNRNVVSGAKQPISQAMFAPSAASVVMRPTTIFGASNFAGKNGLRISGQQRWVPIYSYAGAPSFNGSAVSNWALVDPTNMGGALQVISNGFLRYRFSRLAFTFRSDSATSAAGGIVMGYSSDALSYGGSVTVPGEVGSLIDSAEFAPWNTVRLDCRSLERENLMYNYNSASSDPADIRQCNQGVLLIAGVLNTTGSPAGSQIGTIWIDYDIELYDLADVVNLHLAKKSLANRRLLVNNISEFRESKSLEEEPIILDKPVVKPGRFF